MTSLRCKGILLLASLFLLCTSADAQADRPQPDTAVSDTVVVGAAEGTVYSTGSDSSVPDSAVRAGDSLLARAVPDSVVQEWKKAPDFAYANDPRYWKRMQPESDSTSSWFSRLSSSTGFRYGVYILLGALLLYAIGRIVNENQLGIFFRGAKRSGTGDAGNIDEPVEEEDIDRRLQQAIENRDYRQAVRYSYLRTLRRLDARGLIHYHGRATDQEYLRQLSGTAQELPFRFLTNAYEKVWYGEFGLGEETFRRLIGYFSEFDKTIPG
jgi:hypothetical protein